MLWKNIWIWICYAALVGCNDGRYQKQSPDTLVRNPKTYWNCINESENTEQELTSNN